MITIINVIIVILNLTATTNIEVSKLNPRHKTNQIKKK